MVQGSFGSVLEFVRRHWHLLLGLALSVLVPLVMVADVTEDIFRDGGFPWDQAILDWYRTHRTPFLTTTAQAMAEIGGARILPVLTLGLALLLAMRHRRPQGLFLISSVLGATLLNLTAKVAFHRPRPETLGAVLSERGFSFPSGHAMANTAFGAALVLIFWPTRWRWPVTVVAVLWAVGICASRNYLGVHYPTDVLVGFLSSVAWVAGLYAVMSRRWPRLRRVQEGAVHPGSAEPARAR